MAVTPACKVCNATEDVVYNNLLRQWICRSTIVCRQRQARRSR